MMLMFGLMRLATGVVAGAAGLLWRAAALLGRTLRGMSFLGRPALFGRREAGGTATGALRVEPSRFGRTPRPAEVDRLMVTSDKWLAETWLAVFSEMVGPRPGRTIPGAILNRDSGAMETVQVASHWAIGRRGLTRRQMIDRIATWLACGVPDDWSPKAGDEVEMWSRFTDAWFPAVVDARSEAACGGWPVLTVRLKGNGAGDTGVAKSEIRPLDGAARLAAARREHPAAFYYSYDNDNVRHMQECGGCPDCEGLGEYYRECGDARCGMHHRDEACVMGRMA